MSSDSATSDDNEKKKKPKSKKPSNEGGPHRIKKKRKKTNHICMCRKYKREDDPLYAKEPERPRTLQEYKQTRTLARHLIDSYVTNQWVKHVKKSIPFICECCKKIHRDLYKMVIEHVLKGGEIPGAVLTTRDPAENASESDMPVLSKICIFCRCSTVTCPLQKREIDIDIIRENAKYVSRALVPPTDRCPRNDEGMIDFGNRKGFIQYSTNTKWEMLENLGFDTRKYHLKYLEDDSSLSMIGSECDLDNRAIVRSVHDRENERRENRELSLERAVTLEEKSSITADNADMYLIGMRQKRSVDMSPTRLDSDATDEFGDDDIPERWRGLLTDDKLVGKDGTMCDVCFKRVTWNTETFIFRRVKLKRCNENREYLICTCDLDPYDVIEAEIMEQDNCDEEREEYQKDTFRSLLRSLKGKWFEPVRRSKDVNMAEMDPKTQETLRELARFFYKESSIPGLITPSVSISVSSEKSKASRNEADMMSKMAVVAAKLYKRFYPCPTMQEELQAKTGGDDEGDEGGGLEKIKLYAYNLKLRMMPEDITAKKKKKNPFCDNHDKEEMVGLIKFEVDKLLNPDEDEEKSDEEEANAVVVAKPTIDENLVATSSDEDNVERLTCLINALEKTREEAEQEAEGGGEKKGKQIRTCACKNVRPQPSTENLLGWIKQNAMKANILQKLKEQEEVPVSFASLKAGSGQSGGSTDDVREKHEIFKKPAAPPRIPVAKDDAADTGRDRRHSGGSKSRRPPKKDGDEKKPKRKYRKKRPTKPPDEIPSQSLNYRQLMEYIHSRKEVSFKDIRRMYKYPLLRLPMPGWRLRSALLKDIQDRVITTQTGDEHRVQIFVVPKETWSRKQLKKPLVSYGLLRRRIFPFRTIYPKWIKPHAVPKFKSRAAYKEKLLKEFVLAERKRLKELEKEQAKKRQKGKKGATSKMMGRKFLKAKKSRGARVARTEQRMSNVRTEKSTEYRHKNSIKFMARTEENVREKRKKKLGKEQSHSGGANVGKTTQLAPGVRRLFIAKAPAKIKAKDQEMRKKQSTGRRRQYMDKKSKVSNKPSGKLTSVKVESTAKTEYSESNQDVEFEREPFEKPKYLIKKIFTDKHRHLIIVDTIRNEKPTIGTIRFVMPIVIEKKKRIQPRGDEDDVSDKHPEHVIYSVRNALLKEIKTRFRLPPVKVFIRKIAEILIATTQLRHHYEVDPDELKPFLTTKFKLYMYNSSMRPIKLKTFETCLNFAKDILIFWLQFKIKLYNLYEYLRTPRFDDVAEVLIPDERYVDPAEVTYMNKLKALQHLLLQQVIAVADEYEEDKKSKAQRKPCQFIEQELPECPYGEERPVVAKRRLNSKVLKLFNSMIEILKVMYKFQPISTEIIQEFVLPNMRKIEDELEEEQEFETGADMEDEENSDEDAEPASRDDDEKAEEVEETIEPEELPATKSMTRVHGRESEISSTKLATPKTKKWMIYTFEKDIYRNQRLLTVPGFIQFMKDGGVPQEPPPEETSQENEQPQHIIPGLLGITVEGLMEVEKEMGGKGGRKKRVSIREKKKKDLNRLYSRAAPTRKPKRVLNQKDNTFPTMLVKKLYNIPDLTVRRPPCKACCKAVRHFGKPKIMILPIRKPQVTIIRATNSEPSVITKGELNIPRAYHKMKLIRYCMKKSTKVQPSFVQKLLTSISSDNVVRSKIKRFISRKKGAQLMPTNSDSAILIEKQQYKNDKRFKLKRALSLDQIFKLDKNKETSELIEDIKEDLEDTLTAEVYLRKCRKVISAEPLNTASSFVPLIERISLEEILKASKKLRKTCFEGNINKVKKAFLISDMDMKPKTLLKTIVSTSRGKTKSKIFRKPKEDIVEEIEEPAPPTISKPPVSDKSKEIPCWGKPRAHMCDDCKAKLSKYNSPTTSNINNAKSKKQINRQPTVPRMKKYMSGTKLTFKDEPAPPSTTKDTTPPKEAPHPVKKKVFKKIRIPKY